MGWNSQEQGKEMQDMYAIMTSGGKQYRVREGDTVQIENSSALFQVGLGVVF